MQDSTETEVVRHKAAITRTKLSRPLQLAMDDGIISSDTSIFDFGCGKGFDVSFLKETGYNISGWDPHFFPSNKITPSDVVNLGYVINVIEDSNERTEVLKKAYKLAEKVLIVAVRIEHLDIRRFQAFNDGFITSCGTFQKLYEPDEFKNYLESHLDGKISIVSPGLAYVFKDQMAFDNFLASRYAKRSQTKTLTLLERISQHPSLEEIVSFYESTARLPTDSEIPEIGSFVSSGLSLKRFEKIVYDKCDKKKLESTLKDQTTDLLSFLANYFLANKTFPTTKNLPSQIIDQIKQHFKTLSNAKTETMSLLQSLGNPDNIRLKCRGSIVGKKLPGCIYIHKTAIDKLPIELQLLIALAEMIVGELPYDIVKIKEHGRSISFLFYDDFYKVAHPALSISIKVRLMTGKQSVRSYTQSINKPILHRKELFISAENSHYKKFSTLTKKEEDLGLLSSKNIGYSEQWENLLQEKGLTIRGHRIYNNKS